LLSHFCKVSKVRVGPALTRQGTDTPDGDAGGQDGIRKQEATRNASTTHRLQVAQHFLLHAVLLKVDLHARDDIVDDGAVDLWLRE
jgi:hypothetical protein